MLNYVAAPVGTTEAQLLQYGVEGPDFTRDASGNPVPTQQGLVDTVVPWKNIGGPPDYLFSASSSEYVPVTYQAQKEHFASTVPNPTVGLCSPTDGSGHHPAHHVHRPPQRQFCSAASPSVPTTIW